jgi:23S rRNA (guanosine2251-2'-O)-methyltransferase
MANRQEIIFGRNTALEALKAGRAITRIVLDRASRGDARLVEIVRLAQARAIPCEYVTRDVLDRQSLQGVHQGVLALADPRPSLTPADLQAIAAGKPEAPLYVVIDGIEDPHNLGAILRTSEATGVLGVITRSHRAVGLTPATLKAAAGAAEYVPVVQVANIAQAIENLKKEGVWIVGIDSAAQPGYLSLDYRPATAIVVGAEGEGISPLVKKKCDFLVSIPMKGKITSLNASVAMAVVLYEVLRQRTPRA